MITKYKKPTKPRPTKPRNKGGRPKKQFDLKQVEALGMIQCTQDELAAVLDVNLSTVKRKLKQKTSGFALSYKKGKEKGKSSLRRIQWKAAQGITYYAYLCDQKKVYSLNNICDTQKAKKNSQCGECTGARLTTLTEFKNGSTGMQIWLGKQWLGQRDKAEFTGPKGGPIKTQRVPVDLSHLSDEELALLKKIGTKQKEDQESNCG
jgi:hypothetical protein